MLLHNSRALAYLLPSFPFSKSIEKDLRASVQVIIILLFNSVVSPICQIVAMTLGDNNLHVVHYTFDVNKQVNIIIFLTDPSLSLTYITIQSLCLGFP